jgi:hypothetical protein
MGSFLSAKAAVPKCEKAKEPPHFLQQLFFYPV